MQLKNAEIAIEKNNLYTQIIETQSKKVIDREATFYEQKHRKLSLVSQEK